MADTVEAPSPAEPATTDKPALQRSKKAGGRQAKKPPIRQAPRRVSRAASTVRVKVGGHTIVMPGSLAANLTPKDQKKLLAIFKRVLKRGKKRAAKKRATKKRAAKKR
jgi:hypothetical protein